MTLNVAAAPAGYVSDTYARTTKRGTFSLSDGTLLVWNMDPNSSGAATGSGDHTNVPKIYVWSINAARTASTLRATFSLTVATDGNYPIVAAASFVDGSIAFTWGSFGGSSTYYVKYNHPTSAFLARETVSSSTLMSGFFTDVAVTDGGAVLIAGHFLRTTSPSYSYDYLVFIRNTAGAWSNPITVAGVATGNAWAATLILSSSLVVTGGAGPVRNVVCGLSAGAAGDVGGSNITDPGASIYTFSINETTSAITAAITSRRTGVNALGSRLVGSYGNANNILLFKSGTNEYTFGSIKSRGDASAGPNYAGTYDLTLVRGTWDGTTHTTVINPTTYTPTTKMNSADSQGYVISMSFANGPLTDSLVFYAKGVLPSSLYQRIGDYYILIDRTTNTLVDSGQYFTYQYSSASEEHMQVRAGNDRNFTTKHDVVITRKVFATPNVYTLFHQYSATAAAAPSAMNPVTGVVNTSTPALSATRAFSSPYMQTRIRARFQMALDAAYTTSFRQYFVSEAQGKIASTTGSTVITDVLPAGLRLQQGTWYMRATIMDAFGNTGLNTATQTLTVTHAPAAVPASPISGARLAFQSGVNLQVAWTFSDTSSTDAQTAYEVILERASDGFVITDTGKVVSTSIAATFSVNPIYKDVPLRWKVKVWDTDDISGAYTAYQGITLADSPSVVINTPANGATLTTGVPSVNFTVTVPAGRTITSYEVDITQGSNVVYSSIKTGSWATGAVITETGTRSYLSNAMSYSVRVTVNDSTNMSYTTDPITVFTAWTPPVGVTTTLAVDATPYNVESQGYVKITWTNSVQDADFAGWVIYRKSDMIDPLLNVIEAGVWIPVYTDYSTIINHQYNDYLAPSNYKVQYKVAQLVNRFGDSVESVTNTVLTVYPKSDGYWLVQPQTDATVADAFRISLVTGDSYTDEYESAEYTVIGRGRHVDQGESLGPNGSLDVQIRDSTTRTARYQRRRLETIKKTASSLFLRNPFGDTYEVSVGDMTIARIAGVGTSEFVDMTIPYSEVD